MLIDSSNIFFGLLEYYHDPQYCAESDVKRELAWDCRHMSMFKAKSWHWMLKKKM
jgi:hypothetical protein